MCYYYFVCEYFKIGTVIRFDAVYFICDGILKILFFFSSLGPFLHFTKYIYIYCVLSAALFKRVRCGAIFFYVYLFVIYFMLFLFFFIMIVRTWLRPYIPLFLGVTSCIWGVAILVYHQFYA